MFCGGFPEGSSLIEENGKLYIEVPNVNDFMVKTFRNIPYMNYYYKKAYMYNFNGTGIDYIVKQAGYQYQLYYMHDMIFQIIFTG